MLVRRQPGRVLVLCLDGTENLGARPSAFRPASVILNVATSIASRPARQLSTRFARLAIASAAPSVAEALMAIAFDYASKATKANQTAASERRHDQVDGFG